MTPRSPQRGVGLPRRARLLAPAGLAVGAGVAWAGAAPPRGWWLLFPMGVAALAIALRGRRLRVRAALGALAGVALYVPTLSWLADFTVAGYVAVVLLQVGLLALVAVAVPAGETPRSASGWWALPAALVLLEVVQARFPFGGFPLPALGLSQAGGPFMSAAPLGGSLLVTGAAAAAGIALAALFVPARRRMTVGGAVVVAVLPVAAGSLVSTAAAGDLDVVVVQGGGQRGVRAIFTDSAVVTERHLETVEQIDGSPDLVLLPENVADVDGPISSSPLDARLAAPTGYSAIIVPNGDVVAVSELGAEARLREIVPLRTGLTPYAHMGDAAVGLLAALTLLASARRVRERGKAITEVATYRSTRGLHR